MRRGSVDGTYLPLVKFQVTFDVYSGPKCFFTNSSTDSGLTPTALCSSAIALLCSFEQNTLMTLTGMLNLAATAFTATGINLQEVASKR